MVPVTSLTPTPAPPYNRSFRFASLVVAVLNVLFLVAVGWRLGLGKWLPLQLVEWLGVAGYLLAPLFNLLLHLWLIGLLIVGRLGKRSKLYLFNFVLLLVAIAFIVFLEQKL